MYIRFLVGSEQQDYRWLTGAITEARLLRDEGKLARYEVEWLEQVFEWFNTHLPCPPFSDGRWSRDAVSWFRDTASEPLSRMWDVVALLKQHDIPVRVVRTKNPGRIVYEDDFQVVAETRWRKMKR